jgi:hypothetical protein
VNGELNDPIITYFSQQQKLMTSANQYSSTLREIDSITNTVLALMRTSPHLLPGNMMVYETDNQAGWYDVMGMKGGPRTFPAVKTLRLLCAAHDIELVVEWYPRESTNQVQADAWSKHEDATEWSLDQGVVQTIMSQPVLQGRALTLDAFASTHSTLVPKAFYSRFHCVDSLGVDAFRHSWHQHASALDKRPLVWVNGPFAEMGAIITKIRQERVDCILIRPDWPRGWLATLKHLPVALSMRLPHTAVTSVNLRSKPRVLKYRLVAEYVLW